jgi:hypothetical protein
MVMCTPAALKNNKGRIAGPCYFPVIENVLHTYRMIMYDYLSAGPGRFLNCLFLLFLGVFGFFHSLFFGHFLFHGLFFFSANCAVRRTASATARNSPFFMFGATCARVRASPAACMGAGQCNAPHADQTGDT